MTRRQKVRIGAVNYLNTKPLVFKLEQLAPEAEVIYDLPSRLADDLSAGLLDVALVPSIEIARDPAFVVLSDACIGCRGPVLSVKLFMRVPPQDVSTLALDEGSRTSAALAQILLHRHYGLRPRLMALPIGDALDDTNADAILLIGDRAMHSPPGPYEAVWDLGDQWFRTTGHPFVFAMWAHRNDLTPGTLGSILEQARDAGVAHLSQIARCEAPKLGLTQPQCFDYLHDNLNFRFGISEQQGLELFFRQAVELGLLPTSAANGVPVLKSAG
jgi:chorismate dehydratase